MTIALFGTDRSVAAPCYAVSEERGIEGGPAMVVSDSVARVTSLRDLDDALELAGEAPVVVDRNGLRYRISRVDGDGRDHDFWAGYDPDRARQALHEAAGMFKDVDVDRWIADVYAARRRGSRPPDRP